MSSIISFGDAVKAYRGSVDDAKATALAYFAGRDLLIAVWLAVRRDADFLLLAARRLEKPRGCAWDCEISEGSACYKHRPGPYGNDAVCGHCYHLDRCHARG